MINGVATQGRYGNSVGVEYAEEFYLEYSRDGGLTWTKWKDRKGNHVRRIIEFLINHKLLIIFFKKIISAYLAFERQPGYVYNQR